MTNMAKLRVVYIDDDPLEHYLVERVLGADVGISVVCAMTCKAAASLVAPGQVDVVLLDARIPPENDPDASIAALRRAGCDAPIVVVSSAAPPVRPELYLDKSAISPETLRELLTR